MEENFWRSRWENNQLGFHESAANPNLVANFKALSLQQNDRVFLPLCGKTLDIKWLLSQGFRVVGAELVEDAIVQLFADLKMEPEVLSVDNFLRYTATGIDIFVGNIFDLSQEIVGHVDAVYDRAALVALPVEMREKYTRHLVTITASAPQLLVTFVYDQNIMEGPPFSVDNEEVQRHYDHTYRTTLLESNDVPGGLKGKCSAAEHVWLLR